MPENSFESTNLPVGIRVTSGLAKISMAIRHAAWRQGHQHALTPTQGEALLQLERSPGSTLGELADALGVRASTASEAVDALEAKGLAQKNRRPEDRRQLALQLTTAGRKMTSEVALWPDFLAQVVEDLDPDEQAQLMRLLQRMIRKLQVRGQVPITRMCATCVHFKPWRHEDPDSPHHCGYVDLPFGDRDLRLDCSDHSEAPEADAEDLWRRFSRAAS